jgi:Family of unknown function (DUF6152)
VKQSISLFGSAVLFLFAISSAWAHHSPSAIFEMSKRISVTGTLTKIDWINPHIVIAMEAKDRDGKIEHWTFESNPPSWYRSVGLARADFAKAVGHTVTVEGVRAKNGTPFGYMQKIKMPDGTSLELVNSADPK